jgi:UPF0755 protein
MTQISLFIIAMIVMLTFYLYTPIHSAKIVYVPKGSFSYIVKTFINKGYNLNIFDKYFFYILGSPQSGFIDLGETTFSKIEFLYKLSSLKGAVLDIVAIPGESTYFFLEQLANKLNLSKNKLFDMYNQKALFSDGIILSDTYRINMNMNEKEIVDFLISYSMKKHKQLSYKYLGSYDKKQWFRYVTIASIIQKEAANIDEMSLISSVIYNRIKKHMYLQMDGSLNYGKYAHTKVTKRRILRDKTHFNTYKYKNIPPSPVSMVSINAIQSAIFPKKTDYLYFVINPKTFKHIFTKTYKNHKKYVKSL